MRIFRSQGLYERRGFTLVEIVVSIAVFSLLVALLLPAASYVRKRVQANRTAIAEAGVLHNEANMYLITGKAGEGTVITDKTGQVEIRLQNQQSNFTVEIPR